MSEDPAPKSHSASAVPPVRLREPSATSAAPGAAERSDASDAVIGGHSPPPLPPEASLAAPPPGWEGIFEPGETLLWQGQPQRRKAKRDDQSRSFSDYMPLVIGSAWICLCLIVVEPFWLKFLMAAFGLPFLKGGLNRSERPVPEAETTWYTLSSHSAYIATKIGGIPKLERFALASLPSAPQLIDTSPGDIIFASKDVSHILSSGSDSQDHRLLRRSRQAVGFLGIERPREVFRLLTEARAKLDKP